MNKNKHIITAITAGAMALGFWMVSCGDDSEINNTPSNGGYSKPDNSNTGSGNQDNGNQETPGEPSISQSRAQGYVEDNFAEIESDINLEVLALTGDVLGAKQLPASKDLSDQLPPILDQGINNTCVAFAAGYYNRTYLYGVEKKLSKAELASASNQFSPKDLFRATRLKGNNCVGTSFDAALQVMIDRGIATLDKVPYTNVDDCEYKPDLNAADAKPFVIESFRKIKKDKTEIKTNLAQGKLVLFGAQCGILFKNYEGGVFSYEGSDHEASGHAMVVCGYDDTKGPNGAFKVANSWGKDWGENGFIWIDQKFFVSNPYFIKSQPVIMNAKNTTITVDNNNSVVNKEEGWDLVPSHLEFLDLNDPKYPEESLDPTWRVIYYNGYNMGEKPIPCSKNWCVALMYYNSKDADDNGFFLIDLYTDSFGNYGSMCNDWLQDDAIARYGDPEKVIGIHSDAYCWTHKNINGGQSLSSVVFGNSNKIRWDVQIPSELNGDYFLVLVMDPFGNVEEANEANNYLYYTVDGKPIHFMNGVPTNIPLQKSGNSNVTHSAKDKNPNTYSTEEISALIRAQRNSGVLRQKALNWQKSHASGKVTSHPRTQYE